MRRTALAFITASILSILACGGDDTSSTAGGSGSGGSGGSTGGSSGSGGTTGGTSGTGGAGGTAGSAQPDGGPGGSSADARIDTPTGTMDVQADRTTTNDAPAIDTGSSDVARDTTPQPDAPVIDTSSPPEGGTDVARDAAADSTGGSDAATDSSSFVLTSTAFTEGTMIPAAHTCAGTNVSPPLSWTPGPAGTLSYAVVLTDKTNNLVHSGIYDIPASVTSLPANIEKVANPSTPAGSKQVQNYSSVNGYAGPCPGATAHTYEFMLYAVDIATLPGIMTTQKGAALVTALQAHDLATTTLTGNATTLR